MFKEQQNTLTGWFGNPVRSRLTSSQNFVHVNTLQALVPGSSRAAGLCFLQRAAHYRSLNRALRPKTRFFAAAAWVNDLLGALSSCGRLANPSEALLSTLGGRLLIENNRIARRINAGILNEPPDVLDRQLVESEQLLVEQVLGVQGKSN